MACAKCSKKFEKNKKITTSINNNISINKHILFIGSLFFWPVIAIGLPIIFYFAIYGLPKLNKHQNADNKNKD